MPRPPSAFPSPDHHVAADPAALAESAARLRRVLPEPPPQFEPLPVGLDDAHTPVPAPDSGIARFLSALDAATRAQTGRVTALARYADGAAGALDWFAGAVGDAEDESSARFGREGAVMA